MSKSGAGMIYDNVEQMGGLRLSSVPQTAVG